MQLWTDKYRPEKVEDIISQKKASLEALGFLENWKQGEALLFTGSPGVGKTLMAETLALEKGFHLLAFNASDKRSAEHIETNLLQSTKVHSLFSKGKIILIDEVDGLSSGDRGGAASIVKVIKESNDSQ